MIVDDVAANRLVVRRALAEAGWLSIEAGDGNQAIASARRTLPPVIIMDIDMPHRDGFAAVRAIRASARPLCSVPILVYSATRLTDAEISSRGMDGRIPKPFATAELIAAIAPWMQDGQMAGARQLAASFGADQVAGLVAGLREQLASAVDELDSVAIPTVAHRIAGLAGTLGFTEVSATWLALSEGDESVRDRARREARLAIAAIDRGDEPSTDH